MVLVGAGETIQLVAEHLNGQGVRGTDVVNRTLANAETLAASIDGHAWPLTELGDRIQHADIVIASTGASVPVLGKGMVERAQKVRRHKPMFMVDLAVPRDIEPEVGEIDSVYLYTVDDLQAVVEEGYRAASGSGQTCGRSDPRSVGRLAARDSRISRGRHDQTTSRSALRICPNKSWLVR